MGCNQVVFFNDISGHLWAWGAIFLAFVDFNDEIRVSYWPNHKFYELSIAQHASQSKEWITLAAILCFAKV